jgi:hypothetical protein
MDAFGSADGISRLILRSSDAGKARLVVVGADDVPLGLDTLPLESATDVVVQLRHTDNANCWESSFPSKSISQSKAELFRARTR